MVPPEIVDQYTKILKEYLKESTEQNLFSAYGFSRGCVEREIGPEEVLGIHMEAIDRLMKTHPLPPSHLVISHNLLLEAMMAYGIFYRESLELQKRYVEELKQKNAECREIRVQVEGLNARLEERVQEKVKELHQAQEQIYRMEKLTSL
ncbi:MAG: hypothetical protein HY760_05415, partial [Nitrospirae bacterium]|nr:hypothetical protein [Nitrospirota bacterium]